MRYFNRTRQNDPRAQVLDIEMIAGVFKEIVLQTFPAKGPERSDCFRHAPSAGWTNETNWAMLQIRIIMRQHRQDDRLSKGVRHCQLWNATVGLGLAWNHGHSDFGQKKTKLHHSYARSRKDKRLLYINIQYQTRRSICTCSVSIWKVASSARLQQSIVWILG